jgi:hypothetical protein
MLCVFASEAAALVGLTRWKSAAEVQRDMWRRLDRGHFERCCVAGKRVATREEVVARAYEESSAAREAVERCVAERAPAARVESVLKEVVSSEDVRAALRSEVNCGIGQASEAEGLNKWEVRSEAYVRERNARGYRKDLGGFVLYGRVDGVTEDGVLVEHKQRRNKLFGCVPEYERVQVMAYLKLTGLEKAVVVESFGADQQSHDVEWDSGVWDSYVRDMRMRVQELEGVIESDGETAEGELARLLGRSET